MGAIFHLNEKQKYHTVGTFQKSNGKSLKEEK
jgi:hypothetical protein